MTVVGAVETLCRYPVKSLQGESLERVRFQADGVAGDREVAFVDALTGKVASAKRPRPWGRLLDCAARYDRDEVIVQLPSGRDHRIDESHLTAEIAGLVGREVIAQPARPGQLGSYESTWPIVNGVTLSGRREFSMALATDAVRFVDVAGIHLITAATLQKLQNLAHASVLDPSRFRPNMVIATPDAEAAFLEDRWIGRTLHLGTATTLRITSRAPRCVMTTLEQPGLPHDPGILRAAADNRQHFEGIGTLACAGVYAEVIDPGMVAKGDPVRLS